LKRTGEAWLVLVSFCVAHASFAQSAPPPATAQVDDELAKLSLEELMNLKSSVASRTEESVQRASAVVTVFTREELLAMGVKDLATLLNFVPGINSVAGVVQNKVADISVRGSFDELSKGILFLMDGQVLNDSFSGSAVMLHRALPIGMIERVEVIRGPGSVLYGSNALSAVVSIITKRRNDASAYFSHFNGKGFDGNLYQEWGDVNVQLNASILADEGFVFRDVVDAFGRIRDTRDPLYGHHVNLVVDYQGLSLRLRHADWTARDFIAYRALDPANMGQWQQSSALLRYEGKLLDERLNIGAQLGYTIEGIDVVSNELPQGTEVAPGVTLPQTVYGGPSYQVDTWTAGVDARYRFNDSMQAVGGLSYSYTGVNRMHANFSHSSLTLEYFGELRKVDDPSLIWNNPAARRRVTSFYLQGQKEFGDILILTVGGRLDGFSDVGFFAVPRASAVLNLPWDAHFKVIYGHSYRVPNFFELYNRRNPSDFGNRGLKSETMQSVDVSYIQNIARRAQLALTGFYARTANLISLGADRPDHPDNPLRGQLYINGETLSIPGLELELSAQPFTNFFVRASYSRLFTSPRTPYPIHMASWLLNYRIDRLNLSLPGYYRQASSKLPYQESYVVLNAGASYDILDGVKLGVSVENLLNTIYSTSTGSFFPNGVPNRGRVFFVNLSWGT
jgi:outer membrane receptor protein involved in Fe transport